MIILNLVLTNYWYDKIARGEKQFEYREVKPYWTKRLFSKPYTHVKFPGDIQQRQWYMSWMELKRLQKRMT